ncbi:hypothetical protein CLOSTHATH_03876 [Hungatella hathewayi DSM 13479]|uniref:Uncharacterized protein n=1 Tax=Hungatella hathewayi DSM 13479 TaxID=566550 RepID=D3AJT3_9FIRM|nr:hypothetical protein CLOSTHATH_03876 [Hungatella hathewayi DSM 13479]
MKLHQGKTQSMETYSFFMKHNGNVYNAIYCSLINISQTGIM